MRVFVLCASTVTTLVLVTVLCPHQNLIGKSTQHLELTPSVYTSAISTSPNPPSQSPPPPPPPPPSPQTQHFIINNHVTQPRLRPAPSPPRITAAPLEVYWDEDMPKARICVLPRAYVAKDGKVMIASWMHDVAESCGVEKIGVLKADAWQPVEPHHGVVDLVGYSPLRWHIPHFATDLLAGLYASEVLRPRYTAVGSKHHECYNRGGRVPCGDLRQMTVALYGQSRIAAMNRTDWVPSLAAMIPGRPKILTPSKLFSSRNLACFRSVVAFNPRSYIRPSRLWYGPKHPLFVRNQLRRESVVQSAAANGLCEFNLVIVNRQGWKQLNNYQVGRDIVNIADVVSALMEKAKPVSSTIRLNITVAYFEKLSFPQQIDTMQRAHIILGTHGAGLGNLLFARLDTPVIEVFPFGYYPSTFERLAQALHLRYNYVVSAPDTRYFRRCLANRGIALRNSQLKKQGEARWDEALELWRAGRKRVLFAETFLSITLIPVKRCVRSQRMRIDPTSTAELVIRLANENCRHP